jgi:Tfp pilus assembly protein PilZ
MEDTRILMVVKEAEARAAYEEALRRVGVGYDVAGSFDEVLRLSTDNAYSGLIIDILTLIRSSKEEKLIAYDCLNFYPSLRVKWDARQKCMNLSPLEQSFSADAATTLDIFIESRCRSFAARSLRRHNRKEAVLALLLSSCRDCPEAQSLKSFNISQGGAFVHSTDPFAKGDTVWLRFRELPDQPVRAVVCWRIEWGACRSIPGIGVRFEFASQEQADAVRNLAKL